MIVEPQRWRRIVQIGASLIYLSSMTATGATREEEKLSSAPMPHETLGTSGPRVSIHRVSLRGYLEGNPGNSIRLGQLKDEVQRCVAEHQQSGMQTRPPVDWPDFLTSMREDVYFTVDRSIRYTSGIAYGVNFSDCSLLEVSTARASIVSSSGICEVDLVKKTTSGACGSRSSGVPAGRNVTAINAILRKMAANARTSPDGAVLQKARASGDTRTGEYRTIAGLKCEVRSQVAAGDTASICLARGGSFNPTHLSGGQAKAGLVLEYESKYGPKMKAVNAKFDTEINAKLFEPHMAGGFSSRTGVASK